MSNARDLSKFLQEGGEVDTDTLYVDSTNNRVGIGTTSADQLIHGYQNITGSVRLRLENSEGSADFAADEGGVKIFTDNTERLRIESDGDLQHLSKPAYFARAWVNFNGSGTVSIRNSENVSSVTDNGTGQYTVNLTTSIASNAASISDGNLGGYNRASTSRMVSTTACQVRAFNTGANSLTDLTYIDVAIFG
jgi:hypothetical protein